MFLHRVSRVAVLWLYMLTWKVRHLLNPSFLFWSCSTSTAYRFENVLSTSTNRDLTVAYRPHQLQAEFHACPWKPCSLKSATNFSFATMTRLTLRMCEAGFTFRPARSARSEKNHFTRPRSLRSHVEIEDFVEVKFLTSTDRTFDRLYRQCICDVALILTYFLTIAWNQHSRRSLVTPTKPRRLQSMRHCKAVTYDV